MSFWPEFFIIASVHLMAVASPGPDFAIVLRYAVRYGIKVALAASIGIGCAILLHVAYSLIGIGVLIKTTPWLFRLLSLIAAVYLAYIGIQALRATATDNINNIATDHGLNQASLSLKKAFIAGFITNGLNPKATLFFLSLFAVVISASTPFEYKLIYGLYMALATAAWFSFLSVILTRSKVRNFLLAKGYWFDRAMGLLLLALAIHLIISSFT
ncbi:LysE family translocator [Rheinheimera sp. MMS21-TC3]|uniref:LysE family translocator n=1 Tax=Rheinheimera sp. MMS21-TC3 TaxID=3072790 RepID=UPI0028C4C0BC|nr:LysE family transporter [Rheinheimera sp. MMS21-TC3]WNO61109.1 LysE family transporter [Rheinheimera sp. MMS21-TC3]